MSRILLVAATIRLAACADNPFDPHSLCKLPPGTVDQRLHLSADDANQIFRLVYKASSQRISFVAPRGTKDTVEVTCGYNDILNDLPRLTGDAFTLQKVGSKWIIVHKGWWMR
jgi:hypothetical protein